MKMCFKFLLPVFVLLSTAAFAQSQVVNMQYVVSMEKAAHHLYHVELLNTTSGKTLDFKMCVWTPGYYQILNFAGAIQNFNVTDDRGTQLKWDKPTKDIWRVYHNNAGPVKISYDVEAGVPFVANVYLDETRGYITPGGLFMYLDQELHHPVTIQMKPYSKWNSVVATGLDTIPGRYHTFKAADFDVLYDSPFLMGQLEVLPPFTVQNKPHNFIAYQLNGFDRQGFMDDLKKIVVTGSNIIGEIPYTHYTFLSIGVGTSGGGIEHLNSTSLSFSGSFDTPGFRKKLYNFIAHEYFHHYNVKRIRPIELGPFDYSKENHTNMLWVSEGFTVYYEYMITRRAGLTTNEDMLHSFEENIKNYENKPGHFYQSATQASYDTWGDGPSGRVTDLVNKTISYYDKGPVLGLMLDFNIRHATQNKKSLDDVMRLLYYKYYKQLNRGFTEQEFRNECEKIAGVPMSEVFEYASTVKPPDYPKYFAYGGLRIDTNATKTYDSWLGINARQQKDTLVISSVDYKSPAFYKNIHAGTKILTINGAHATTDLLNKTLEKGTAGDIVSFTLLNNDFKQNETVALAKKTEKTFAITPLPNPDTLQLAIYKSWIGN